MEWTIFLVLAVAALVAGIGCAVWAGRSHKADPFHWLFAGVAACIMMLFLPVYMHTFSENDCGLFETILLAVHNMIRLFIVDCDFDFVTQHIGVLTGWQYRAYSLLFSVMFVTAPLLTFGFVLSFFKNVSAYRDYWMHFGAEVSVFSKLNERSLALATSLREKYPTGHLLVFTDVKESETETDTELRERASALGCIFFHKSISDCNLSFHSKKSRMTFFAIAEDESKNLEQALELVRTYRDRENTRLYVFSGEEAAELLLQASYLDENGKDAKIHIRRINQVRSLVNHLLYQDGYGNLYESAKEDENGVRQIGAVVMGMGQHGTAVLKALPWFCQMDGYEVRIHAFDKDPEAENRFTCQCPELMDKAYNGNFTDHGEARYEITIHSGMDLETESCVRELKKLTGTTYVFVAVGTDEQNIAAAAKLRSLFESMGVHPVIQAVVRNSGHKQALQGIRNFKKVPYDIDFVGDLNSCYSESVVLASQLEQTALARHMRWDGSRENDFWQFDYNYGSSLAAAIHYEVKKACNMPGIFQKPEDRDPEARQRIRVVEHSRWNAYMRSEGYSYGETRNDMAKRHHCLVTFEKLPLSEQEKDDD